MFNKFKIITALILILTGIIGRFFLIHFVGIPNFEMITALTLVSAVFLGGAWIFIVPLSVIAVSDIFIGNNSVLFFTWSAFAIIGIFGFLYKKFIIQDSRSKVQDSSRNSVKRIFEMTGLGVGSAIFFYLYTNFGWWLVSNMYPHTLDGLIQCYIMGLPFFKNNLIGNLIFVPMASGAAMFAISLKAKIKNQNKKLQLKIQN